jgi:hypothetical protein
VLKKNLCITDGKFRNDQEIKSGGGGTRLESGHFMQGSISPFTKTRYSGLMITIMFQKASRIPSC